MVGQRGGDHRREDEYILPEFPIDRESPGEPRNQIFQPPQFINTDFNFKLLCLKPIRQQNLTNIGYPVCQYVFESLTTAESKGQAQTHQLTLTQSRAAVPESKSKAEGS